MDTFIFIGSSTDAFGIDSGRATGYGQPTDRQQHEHTDTGRELCQNLKQPVRRSKTLTSGEDFLKERYPEPATGFKATDPDKKKEAFRDYETNARPTVREFYRLNHRHQTHEFVQGKRTEFLGLKRMKMGVWQAAEYLNQLVDDSDPDTDMSQLEHLLQTAEQLRQDGQPRWMILTGFVHDLGKILCLWGEPQWAVVGDTFPTGCAFSDKIVFPKFFADNPDSLDPRYQSRSGV